MKRDEVIPVLYDLAMTIGGEVKLGPLLTRVLQRLLYHTSFPAGFICLSLPKADDVDSEWLEARLDAAVGDYKLLKHVGERLMLPRALLFGPAAKEDDQTELLSGIPATVGPYRAFLRLPIGNLGVVILLAYEMPATALPLTRIFEPTMAHLARAIMLCRHYQQHTDQLLADKLQATTRAEFLALHDALTSLPHRGLLLDRIQQAMTLGARTGQFGALVTLNIDHFKQLNDIYGYEACDQILVESARRLERCVREGDTVARFGGDEFILLLWPLPTAQNEAAIEAERIARKVQEHLNLPFHLNGGKYSASFSIGVSLFHAHLDSLESLLKNAETSVQQAKSAGRNTIRFFDPDIQAVVMSRLELKADLMRALRGNEFMLYYQAQVDAQKRVTGAEVLLRWNHPQRGMVSPSVFVPLAEETGVIVEQGMWVLQQACEQLLAWQQHPQKRSIQLAVNVSAVQFQHPDFIAEVCKLMNDYADIASLVKLELTESVVLDSAEEVIYKIQMLKNLGIRFSIDDFGTGYSSLAYLKRLPLDQLKIDQSFVRDIATDPSAAVIVQTIIGMAHNLGLDVIAEGVESKEQLDLLKHYGCNAYQGYLFSRPLPAEAFEDLLASDTFPYLPG